MEQCKIYDRKNLWELSNKLITEVKRDFCCLPREKAFDRKEITKQTLFGWNKRWLRSIKNYLFYRILSCNHHLIVCNRSDNSLLLPPVQAGAQVFSRASKPNAAIQMDEEYWNPAARVPQMYVVGHTRSLFPPTASIYPTGNLYESCCCSLKRAENSQQASFLFQTKCGFGWIMCCGRYFLKEVIFFTQSGRHDFLTWQSVVPGSSIASPPFSLFLEEVNSQEKAELFFMICLTLACSLCRNTAPEPLYPVGLCCRQWWVWNRSLGLISSPQRRQKPMLHPAVLMGKAWGNVLALLGFVLALLGVVFPRKGKRS